MKIKINLSLTILIVTIVGLGAAVRPADASAPASQTLVEQAAVQPAKAIDAQELEAFVDDVLEREMAEAHVPGAMVAVVQDGHVLLAKGYGYANVENQVPVDAERTLFRIGSVSKLFVWTAVMQLLEQGQLSLDSDVNEYLDFAIPDAYPEPVTVRHLMSHTAGFEDKGMNMHRLQAEHMSSLEVYVKDNLPVRVFPPGEVIAYSNYGTALAGYIVERVSGLSFDTYVEQNIFAPLGMAHSSFRQPLPDSLAEDMATGYSMASEAYIPGSFVFNQSYPVGAMSATASDMARFMMAHLQNGMLEDQRILQEASAVQMHSELYSPDTRLGGGAAYGFFENMLNGQRVILHGGNLFNFISGLYLIPEQNVGVFISTNGTNGGEVVLPVMESFLDHYYPAPEVTGLKSADGFGERIAPFLGEYTAARSNFSTSERLFGLMNRPMARLDDDNMLVLSGFGQEQRFVEVEPGLLQAVEDPAIKMIYRRGADGRAYLMGTAGLHEPQTLVKTAWYGTRTLHVLLLASGLVLFLATLIAWPIGAFAGRRKQGASAQPAAQGARLARWTAVLFGVLLLAVMLGTASIFVDIVPGLGVPRIVVEIPAVFTMMLALALLLGCLALAMAVFAARAWKEGYWSRGGRIFYSLLTVFALLLTWSLAYWNLLL